MSAWPCATSRKAFAGWIRKAVSRLPPHIRHRLDNVAIVLEEGTPRGQYLGLYRGIPCSHRGLGYSGVLPDIITLYAQALEREAANPQALPELVRRVVWHEIGHHFGFSEPRIRRLEQGWTNGRTYRPHPMKAYLASAKNEQD